MAPPIDRFIGRTIGLIGTNRYPIVAKGALVRRPVPSSPKERVKLILAFLEAKAVRRLCYKIVLGLPTGESIMGPGIDRVVVRDSVAVVSCQTWLLVGPIGFESLTLCSPEHAAVSTKSCIFTLDEGEQRQFRLEGRWGLT